MLIFKSACEGVWWNVEKTVPNGTYHFYIAYGGNAANEKIDSDHRRAIYTLPGLRRRVGSSR